MKKRILLFLLILMASVRVYAYDAEGYITKIDELKTLLTTCEELGLECPYEEMQITAMGLFTDPSVLSNTDYVAARIDEIYTDTKTKLQSYIEGTDTPLQAPQYILSPIQIKNKSIIADTTWGERPVFMVGYGHFLTAVDDFPIFSKLGASITQQEAGISRVIFDGTIPYGWTRERSSNAEQAICDITNNNDTNHVKAGEGSIRLEMETDVTDAWAYVAQQYDVEPDTTYVYSLFIKAENAGGVCFTPGNGKWIYAGQSDDFERYSGTFTTTSTQTSIKFIIKVENPGVYYADHVSVLKKDSSVNLIDNGTFEHGINTLFGENNEYMVSTDWIDSTFIPMLEYAGENNIAVSVLLSPHYFPGFVKNYHPELYENGKVNIFSDEYILILDKYIEAFISAIKDYDAVHNIILTNEPAVNTAKFPSLLPDFQAWLETQYSEDITSLNDAYETAYTDFSQVPFPAEATEGAEPVGSQTRCFYDWMIYNNKRYAAWHKHMADEVKKYMPDAKVSAKIQDYFDYDSSSDFARYRMTWGIEAEDFAGFSDLHGNDGGTYWSWNQRHIQGQLKWYDYLSSLKNAPVFNSEHHIVEDFSKLYNTEMAGFTGADLFQGAIHGRGMDTIWVWEQTADESSLFSGNALQRPDFIVEIGKTALDLNRLANEVTALENNEAEMAIMCSNVERVYNKNHFTIIDLMYKASLYSGQRVSFVTDTQLDEVNKYKMIIVPNVTHISDENLAILEKYKASGGKVMLVGDCFTHDDFANTISPDMSGYITASLPVQGKSVLSWAMQIYEMMSDNSVKVCDASGNIADGVEWSYVKSGNKVIVNICNYTSKDISGMKLLIDGEAVEPMELVSDTQLAESFTAKTYEPMILQYETYSVIENVEYADGKVSATLKNPLENDLFFRARVKSMKDNKLISAGGISGITKPSEIIKLNVGCPQSGVDEILLEITSDTGTIMEIWSIPETFYKETGEMCYE